jgi:hypothetical protein
MGNNLDEAVCVLEAAMAVGTVEREEPSPAA